MRYKSAAIAILLDHELDALMLKYVRRGVEVRLLRRAGKVAIVGFVVAKNLRGHGVARSTMIDLCAWADRWEHALGLTPSGMYGADAERLKMFFRGLGFEKNREPYDAIKAPDALVRYPRKAVNANTPARGPG